MVDGTQMDVIYREIGWLRLIGLAALLIAFVSAVLFAARSDWGMVWISVELAFGGLLVRAVGGMWASLEHIARK